MNIPTQKNIGPFESKVSARLVNCLIIFFLSSGGIVNTFYPESAHTTPMEINTKRGGGSGEIIGNSLFTTAHIFTVEELEWLNKNKLITFLNTFRDGDDPGTKDGLVVIHLRADLIQTLRNRGIKLKIVAETVEPILPKQAYNYLDISRLSMRDRYGKRYFGEKIFENTKRGSSGVALKYINEYGDVEYIGAINAIFSRTDIVELEQLIPVVNGKYKSRTMILHLDGRITR